ncbi:hypothetical protein OAH05_02270, partial [bacterium]|nr:hypothetical protein [bacterium]
LEDIEIINEEKVGWSQGGTTPTHHFVGRKVVGWHRYSDLSHSTSLKISLSFYSGFLIYKRS